MINISATLFVSIIGLVIVLLGAIIGFIISIVSRLTRLETQMSLFWPSAGGAIVKMLKQPIHLRKDTLLDKLRDCPDEMTNEELIELKGVLKTEEFEEINGHPFAPIANALTRWQIENILTDRKCCIGRKAKWGWFRNLFGWGPNRICSK
jgi:hypothetical protein